MDTWDSQFFILQMSFKYFGHVTDKIIVKDENEALFGTLQCNTIDVLRNFAVESW